MGHHAQPDALPARYRRELRCPLCNKKYGEHYKGLVVLNCCNQISVLDSGETSAIDKPPQDSV